MKRIRGYLRLACAVTGRPESDCEALLSRLPRALRSSGHEFEVTLRNRRYTGPLLGHWFEQGTALVGEEAAMRFASAGYQVHPVEPSANWRRSL